MSFRYRFPPMVKCTNPFLWLVLGGVCLHLSCNLIDFGRFRPRTPSGDTLATTPVIINQSTDTVSIDIFIIHLAPRQHELLQQLWQEIDEQSLPPQLRRELLVQGFRVGVLGSLLSPALAQLLSISADAKADVALGEIYEISAADVAREPTATRNMRNLLPGMSALVKVFDTPLPEQSLFWEENGMMHGQTYTGAIGLFRVSATANRDGSAQVQIVPELEHGIDEPRFRVRAGMVVQETGKPRHSFESLTVSHRLLPGQWLIVGTTTPDSAGAGKAFFVRKDSGMEQRLLAIRLIKAIPAVAAPTVSPLTASTQTGATLPERDR